MKTKTRSKLLTTISALMVLVLFGWVSMSFVNYQDAKTKPWDAPEASKKMKNPVKSSPESIAAGKTLFAKHCKSCHGATGKGDGPKSKELDTPSGDFSVAEFQSQSDGSLYYKTKEGRDDMPSFSKKITEDEDYWNIVNFVRTLGAK